MDRTKRLSATLLTVALSVASTSVRGADRTLSSSYMENLGLG